MLYIDIGSNRGEEIQRALEKGYEVHAFEPNPDMKEFLQYYEDVATINYAAAWDKDGEAVLYNNAPEEANRGVGASLIKEKCNVYEDDSPLVKTINIGRYLKDLDRDIDILKIDAEGAEYVILESIYQNFDTKRIKKILLEDHANYIISKEWELHKQRVLDYKINIEPWINQL